MDVPERSPELTTPSPKQRGLLPTLLESHKEESLPLSGTMPPPSTLLGSSTSGSEEASLPPDLGPPSGIVPPPVVPPLDTPLCVAPHSTMLPSAHSNGAPLAPAISEDPTHTVAPLQAMPSSAPPNATPPAAHPGAAPPPTVFPGGSGEWMGGSYAFPPPGPYYPYPNFFHGDPCGMYGGFHPHNPSLLGHQAMFPDMRGFAMYPNNRELPANIHLGPGVPGPLPN